MAEQGVVFVVDDDDASRDSIAWLVESVGLRAKAFASARQFLDAYNPAEPGCLVVDVRMDDMTGLELQAHLAARGDGLPVIVVTGYGTVPEAVRAFRVGAVDFLEKPLNQDELIRRIREALSRDARGRADRVARLQAAERVGRLTAREREIMGLVVRGHQSKQIAHRLGLSVKTVEVHRGNVMRKTEATSVADLVRLALAVEEGRALPGAGGGQAP